MEQVNTATKRRRAIRRVRRPNADGLGTEELKGAAEEKGDGMGVEEEKGAFFGEQEDEEKEELEELEELPATDEAEACYFYRSPRRRWLLTENRCDIFNSAGDCQIRSQETDAQSPTGSQLRWAYRSTFGEWSGGGEQKMDGGDDGGLLPLHRNSHPQQP